MINILKLFNLILKNIYQSCHVIKKQCKYFFMLKKWGIAATHGLCSIKNSLQKFTVAVNKSIKNIVFQFKIFNLRGFD